MCVGFENVSEIRYLLLALDQRVAGGEFLGDADDGVVDRGVAMRVILAHHVADDAGAFLEGGLRVELELVHGPEDAAMDGFQAVSHVGEGAGGDGGEGVGEVALGEGVGERGDRKSVV